MRTFAAATVVAVAAALLAASALVVSIVGTLESLGLLAGRTSVEFTDLPYGLTTAQQVQKLATIATDSDVALSMLVPDRDGRAGAWTAYTLRGEPATPVFAGHLDVRPVLDGADLDLLTTFAIGGSEHGIAAFLDGLRDAGYEFAGLNPTWYEPLLVAVERPTTLAALVATALAVVVALVAESIKRSARQVLRRTVGWSRLRLVAQETREIGSLVGAIALVLLIAVVCLLWLRQADVPTWSVTVPTALAALGATSLGIVVAHVLCSLWWARDAVAATATSSLHPVVMTTAVALLVLTVVDFRAAVDGSEASDALESTLVAEASRGNDVVLGTNFTAFEQDVAFGDLALEALRRGEASMAQSSFVDQFTVVGEASTVLESFADEVADAAPGGEPVLLVPEVLEPRLEAVRAAATSTLADGWEVDEASPPDGLVVVARSVPSTASIVEAVADWTSAAPSDASSWPEVPVLVVRDPAQIAPNRLGTAVANGEVRFSDRSALERSLADRDLSASVLQIRRVGAVVEGKLGALRAERLIAEILAVATGLVLVFAVAALISDHRARNRRSARLRFLVGRHPAVAHRTFVAGGLAMTFAVVAATELVFGTSLSGALTTAAVVGSAVAAVLISLLALTGRRERNIR